MSFFPLSYPVNHHTYLMTAGGEPLTYKRTYGLDVIDWCTDGPEQLLDNK